MASDEPQEVDQAADGPSQDERRIELEKRLAELDQERRAASEEGDQAAEASALRKLGDLQRAARMDDVAREAYSKARYLYQLTGNSDAAAGLSVTVGNMDMRLHRYEPAARSFQQARDLYQRLAEPSKEADCALSEGDALVAFGDSTGALACFESAGEIFAKLDDTLGQAHTAFRVGTMALEGDPQEANQQLELAQRLFADHVGREASGSNDAPLPARVSDSRRYAPSMMQRVCLRERQGVSGGKAPATPVRRRATAPGIHKAVSKSSGDSSWTIWIGVGLLLVGAGFAILPDLFAGSTLIPEIGDWIGGIVSIGSATHFIVALFGAILAIVGARQLGISAPVVLLAMAIGFGVIFHEISRVVFSDLNTTGPAQTAGASGEERLERQALQLARSAAAKWVLDGRSALERGDSAAATQAFEESYVLSKQSLDTKGQVRALEEILSIVMLSGDLRAQLEVAEKLYDDVSGFDDSRSREILEDIVSLSSRLGDHSRSRDTHLKLLAHHEKTGDVEGEVAALLSLAAIDRDRVELETSYEWYRRAHGVYQSLRDRHGQIGTLLAMGELDARLGRRRRAYGRYYHAFAMYRELEDEGGQAAMLLHMGTLDEAGERFEEASAAFRQSKRMYAELSDRRGEAQAALRFGSVQATHGNQRQARDAFRRSLQLYKALGDVAGQARAELGLGHVALKGAKNDIARNHYTRARVHYQQLNDPRGELAALSEIALLERQAGRQAFALASLGEVKRVASEVSDPAMRANVLLSAGDLALSLDANDEAISTYRRARDLFEDMEDEPGLRAVNERLVRAASRG